MADIDTISSDTLDAVSGGNPTTTSHAINTGFGRSFAGGLGGLGHGGFGLGLDSCGGLGIAHHNNDDETTMLLCCAMMGMRQSRVSYHVGPYGYSYSYTG